MMKILENMLEIGLIASAENLIDKSPVKASTLSPGDYGGFIFKIVLSLIIVAACVAVTIWMIKKAGRFNHSAFGNLKIIDSLNLGARERLLLLQVADQQVLVAISPGHIETILVLNKNIETPPAQIEKTFSQKLKQIMINGGVKI